MEMTVRYRSSRKEVSEWYWKKWRERFWLYHVIFFVLIVTVSVGRWPPRSSTDVVRGLTLGLLAVIGAMAYPQIMFKPQDRTLTASEHGIDTEIGKIRRHIEWNEIGRVEDESDVILIIRKRSGNAFIVPGRAFQSPQDRETFYKAIRDWHAKTEGDLSE